MLSLDVLREIGSGRELFVACVTSECIALLIRKSLLRFDDLASLRIVPLLVSLDMAGLAGRVVAEPAPETLDPEVLLGFQVPVQVGS